MSLPGLEWHDCLRVLECWRHAPFKRSAHALLLVEGGLVYKFCRPQRFPKDYLRRYLGSSQAARERRGAKILARIGVTATEALAAHMFVNPASEFESVLVSRLLPDARAAEEVLLALGDGNATHASLVTAIAEDLSRMVHAGWLYKDLHLGNVLVAPNGGLVWIDTDLRRIRWAPAEVSKAFERLMTKGARALGESGRQILCVTLSNLRLR